MGGDVPMSASTIDHRTDRVNANKLEPSEVENIESNEGEHKGYARDTSNSPELTGLTRCNPNTITEPLYPTTHAVWPSYSDGEVIL